MQIIEAKIHRTNLTFMGNLACQVITLGEGSGPGKQKVQIFLEWLAANQTENPLPGLLDTSQSGFFTKLNSVN